MKEKYQIVSHDLSKLEKASTDFLNEEVAVSTHRFHSSFPQYSQTPLVNLKDLASELGLKSVYIKDESYRFGLNAFKVLGGSYAVGRFIAGKLNRDLDDLPYSTLVSDQVKSELGDITFITATDGNHGRGLAWTANELKQKSIVYMPKGSAEERLNNILACNADASIKDLNYDECVRLANEAAEKNGYVMVQDTAWEGYEDIPTWIMQGYTTMAYEAYMELKEQGVRPTHIFLQAGVGSLASAVTGFFSSVYPDNKPIITIVEPAKADCLYQTAKADDGKLHFVTGDMSTIMAGLACGEPCTIGWDVLHSYAENFMSVPDEAAAHGMRVLGNPMGDDTKVVSGESGAATMGVVAQVMKKQSLSDLRETLKLDENSVVLLFSTEGDTDVKNYREIVWNGKYPNESE